MQFDTPAGPNPIDRLKVVGQATRRVDGPLKVSGTATYAYEHTDIVLNPAYGFILGAGIAKGRIRHMDAAAARKAPGVLAVITTLDEKPLPISEANFSRLFGGPEVAHYNQAIAIIVAETFEQARAAAYLIAVDYAPANGRFDLAEAAGDAPITPDTINDGPDAPLLHRLGNVDEAFAAAPVKLDATYTTPDQTHAMMEPHASIAVWSGDKLTVWTSSQWISWARRDLAKTLSVPEEHVRVISPFIGGGFGAKLYLRVDAVLAALAAKATGHPVKVALQRPLITNNTTHRRATIQHIRLAADHTGKLVAIAHSSTCGNVSGGTPEPATGQTNLLYAAPNRETLLKLAVLDLPEGNDMRAPGEAAGLAALEIAMDEMAEKLAMDPVAFRIVNDTQVDPERPKRAFSERHLVECLQTGAERFGWSKRPATPGQVREGDWLIGMGVAAGIRNNLLTASKARIRLERDGSLVVETDMTDIGTGSYTILAQTAAEMLGVGVDAVTVRLGDSDYPPSAGSGGQWGANNATAGLYAACVKLREAVARRLGFDPASTVFEAGKVRDGEQVAALADATREGLIVAEDGIEYRDVDQQWQQSTFAAHFAEVGVNVYTGEIRVRRMLAVCDAGRILNPLTARSQMIGAMMMGIGGALMEELAVDTRLGFFINHDLGSYEVPVHADTPTLDVVFLDHPDAKSSPMKAKGVGELGLCGVAAAIANATYNATGVRVREYPITLEKHLLELPAVA